MPVNASLWTAFAPKPRSVADFDNEYAQQQANQLQMLLGRNQLQDYEQARAAENALAQILGAEGGLPVDPLRRSAVIGDLARRGHAKAALGLQDKFQAFDKAALETRGKQAEITVKNLEVMERNAAWLQANPTPENAVFAIQDYARKTGDDVSGTLAMVARLQSPDDIRRFAAGFAQKAKDLLPTIQTRNTGGSTDTLAIDPLTGIAAVTGSVRNTQTPDSIASNARMAADAAAGRAVQIRGQNLSDERARQLNDINREAQRTQIINDPLQGLILVDKGTGEARPAVSATTGAPIPGEKAAAKQAGAKSVLGLIEEAESLIDKATGSGIGAAADYAAGTVGKSTPGAQAIAKLRVMEGALLAQMPRMEGPQSNYDVQMYKQAAGQIGDPTVPRETKRAALAEVRRIQETYANGAQGSWGGPERRKPAAGVVDFSKLK